jgi:uncharacterized membrane protein YidH (DUF202 family)
MYIVATYLAYLAIGLGVTVWAAGILHRHGRAFLEDAFQGDAGMADSVNRLLVAGFYLIDVGYVALALGTARTPGGMREAIELLCDKIGVVLLVLGIMHFVNLYIFSQIRKRGRERPRITPAAGWGPAGTPVGKVLE